MRYLVAVLILALAASCETAPEYFVLVPKPLPVKAQEGKPAVVAKPSPVKPEEAKPVAAPAPLPVKPEEPRPVIVAEPLPVKPQESKRVAVSEPLPVKPKEEKPVVVEPPPMKPEVKPEESKPVAVPAPLPVKPEEPKPVVVVQPLPIKPEVKPDEPKPVVAAALKPKEDESAVVSEPSPVKPKEGEAKIVIVREKRFLMSGQKARIAINGKQVAELGDAETYAGVCAPGKTVLSVTSIQYGRYVIEINAEPNKEYTFDVKVNNNFIAATYSRAGVLGGTGAYAADQIHKDGPFSIMLKEVR